MKEPGLFPGCPVRGCKPVKWRDNGDQVCCGCLRHSSVSLRAPLSEREGTLPPLTARRATVQRHSTQAHRQRTATNPHTALATSNCLFCLRMKRMHDLICLLIAKCRHTRQYFASPWHPFTNTILWPFRVTLPQRKCAAETF